MVFGVKCNNFLSSAYVVIYTSFGGSGMSKVKILNNIGDKTPPCDLSFVSVPLY